MRNLTLAFRTLAKSPFVTGVAVLSLALGIGANAAIFSLFEQMLLRSLPVHEPDRLVNVSSPGPKMGAVTCGGAGPCEYVFSYPMYRDLEKAATGMTGLAAHRDFDANLAFDGQTMNGEGMLVSGSYFGVLGLKPALGRLLTPEDDRTIGGHFVAVLSHDYWQNQLGGTPDVLNQPLVVNGQSLTVVGVAPRGFRGTTLGSEPRVFVPLTMRGQMQPGFDGFENRGSYWAYLFGRLAPGVSAEQAAAGLNAAYRPLIREVEAPMQSGASESYLEQFRQRQIVLEPGARGQSDVHTEAATPLTLLLGITGLVLLIACANIANLLLARGAGRSMEMAVRLSLGASRRQVVGQLLTESLVLAAMGGVASLLVAQWTMAGIASILPPSASGTLDLTLQPAAIALAAVLAVGTGLLFGLFPALNSTRPELVSTIRGNAGQIAGARSAARFRTTLVTAQIALSMALLVCAGLFLQSLRNIGRVDLGMDPQNVVAFGISPELNGYEPARAQQLFRRVEEELAALPGVTGVTAAMVPLLTSNNWGNNVSVEGFRADPDTDTNAQFNEVGPGYFRTLGVPLLAGREFTDADGAGTPRVAIVNEAFARKFGLGRDAVGRRMARGNTTDLDVQIVGIAQDAKYSEVKDEVPPLYFLPYRQNESLGVLSFYVRTQGDPDQLLRAIPPAIARLDPNLPVEELKTLPQQARENVFLDRMISILSGAFAVLATLLAAVGLYGVLAYTVAQRTREIGVRMALGADNGRVRRMVLRQVGWMVAIGGAVGIAAAVGLGRVAGALLYGLEGNDPVVFGVAAAVLTAVALAAGYLPAWRASRIDPMQALRYE